MATVELKDSEWKEFSKADYAVIDCYGENCTACVMLAPIYDAVADEQCLVAVLDLYPLELLCVV